MTNKKIGILYIATGNYDVFWSDFYESSEKYFLNKQGFEKHYFIFSDHLERFPDNSFLHKYDQNNLPWPYITLFRFDIFNKAKSDLEDMDYIFFFNANMRFTSEVNEEFLPEPDLPLVMVKHPGFYEKTRQAYSYESNSKSSAYIEPDKGQYYFMGGLNGGYSKRYLKLIDTLSCRVKTDFDNGVLAVWHDESHLNRYAVDYGNEVKVLSPSYGYQQDKELPFEEKIIIRDKNYYGGHDSLRNRDSKIKAFFKRWNFERKLRASYHSSI